MFPPQLWALCHPEASVRWGSSEPAPPSLSGPSPRWRAWPSWPRPSSRTRVTAAPSTRGAADRGETRERKKLPENKIPARILTFSHLLFSHFLVFLFEGKVPWRISQSCATWAKLRESLCCVNLPSAVEQWNYFCQFAQLFFSGTASFLSITFTSKH